jgi:hypothetical protein
MTMRTIAIDRHVAESSLEAAKLPCLPHGLGLAVGSLPVRRVELAALALELKVEVADQLVWPVTRHPHHIPMNHRRRQQSALCTTMTMTMTTKHTSDLTQQEEGGQGSEYTWAVGVQVMTTRLISTTVWQHVQH